MPIMPDEENVPAGPSAEYDDPSGRVRLYAVDPRNPGEFERLSYELTGIREGSVLGPLRRILEVVRLNGCQSVLVEERYSDADYHSEYSTFWSQRHQERTRDAKRLHFFAERITAEQLAALPSAQESGYLGYSVLRPTRLGPVGRTVVLPPPNMQTANL